MRKHVAWTLLSLLLVAATAFAHGANSHRLMGTVKGVQDDQLTVTTTGGEDKVVLLVADTKYEKDQKPVDRAALATGARVSIDLREDDKTAVKIKIGAGGGHAGH
jgi:hypothetical protein